MDSYMRVFNRQSRVRIIKDFRQIQNTIQNVIIRLIQRARQRQDLVRSFIDYLFNKPQLSFHMNGKQPITLHDDWNGPCASYREQTGNE